MKGTCLNMLEVKLEILKNVNTDNLEHARKKINEAKEELKACNFKKGEETAKEITDKLKKFKKETKRLLDEIEKRSKET